MKQEETHYGSNLNSVELEPHFNPYISVDTPKLEEDSIIFCVNHGQKEMLKLCANGDIFVQGKLIESDLEVVEGLRNFLKCI